jgi:hypothetical protein
LRDPLRCWDFPPDRLQIDYKFYLVGVWTFESKVKKQNLKESLLGVLTTLFPTVCSKSKKPLGNHLKTTAVQEIEKFPQELVQNS